MEKHARNNAKSGFSLIELMVAVAVVGILAAIAYPSYTQYIKRSNRAAAQAFMMDIADKQARYFVDARSYADDLATLQLTTPSKVASLYTFTFDVSVGPPATFKVTAAPKGAQSGDATLTLDNTGAKTPADKW